MFLAYLIENKNTGGKYVGVTRRTVAIRWRQHVAQSNRPKGALARAIKKYGKDAFNITHIASTWSNAALADLEVILIAQYGTYEDGYNLTIGGDGGSHGYKHTAAFKMKLSKDRLGVPKSPEARRNISIARIGMKLSSEHKDSIRDAAVKISGTIAGRAVIEKAVAQRVANAARNRAEGRTAKQKPPLDPNFIRNGSPSIRTIETRERMRLAARVRGITHSKINAIKAGEIKWLIENSNWTQHQIGKIYGIGGTQISNIFTGRSWASAPINMPDQG